LFTFCIFGFGQAKNQIGPKFGLLGHLTWGYICTKFQANSPSGHKMFTDADDGQHVIVKAQPGELINQPTKDKNIHDFFYLIKRLTFLQLQKHRLTTDSRHREVITRTYHPIGNRQIN
jgi:hypothetical protein